MMKWSNVPSVLLVAVIIAAGLSKSAEAKTEMIGHRGVMRSAPENTLAAIAAAAKTTRIVELDVQMSKDGKAVLMHDSTVDRTTDGTGKVAELTFDEIKRLDAGSYIGAQFSAERVPSLHEALVLVARLGLTALLDVKNCSAEALASDIVKAKALRSVIVNSQSTAFLKEVNRLLPKAELCFQGTTFLPAAEFAAHIAALRSFGVRVIMWDKPGLPAGVLKAYRAKGLRVFVWNSNDLVDAVRLIHEDVDGIIADDPAGLSALAR